MLQLAGRNSSAYYERASLEFNQLTLQMELFFKDYDMILTPTLALPPLEMGALKYSQFHKLLLSFVSQLPNIGLFSRLIQFLSHKMFNFMPFTPLFNITGQPAMSIPLYWNAQNLPIGCQFASRLGNEIELLQLATSLERIEPWINKQPVI